MPLGLLYPETIGSLSQKLSCDATSKYPIWWLHLFLWSVMTWGRNFGEKRKGCVVRHIRKAARSFYTVSLYEHATLRRGAPVRKTVCGRWKVYFCAGSWLEKVWSVISLSSIVNGSNPGKSLEFRELFEIQNCWLNSSQEPGLRPTTRFNLPRQCLLIDKREKIV